MIERRVICQTFHETNSGGYSFGGVEMRTCPTIPENMLIPFRKVPVVIFGPNGERFDSYRYELASTPKKLNYAEFHDGVRS